MNNGGQKHQPLTYAHYASVEKAVKKYEDFWGVKISAKDLRRLMALLAENPEVFDPSITDFDRVVERYVNGSLLNR